MGLVRFGIVLGALAAFAFFSGAAGAAQTGAPVPTPSPLPPPAPLAPPDVSLTMTIWISGLVAIFVACVTFLFTRPKRTLSADGPTDRDLEDSRIGYGFWLIVASLFVTLAIVIVTMTFMRYYGSTVSDVIALVTSVTGVVGTLTASFFGIQAAGAGRSQAISALGEQLKAAASPANATQYSVDPAAGPHAGNTRVAIHGNGFSSGGDVDVNFGSTPGTGTKVENDAMITTTTPAVALDRKAMTQKGKSDVPVVVAFKGKNTPNVTIGTFYYYTVDVERSVDGKDVPYLNVYGSGLAGVSQVQLGQTRPIDVTAASDDLVQVRIYEQDAPAGNTDYADVWSKVWNQEVEVALIYASDKSAATKSAVIGRYRIPQLAAAKETAAVEPLPQVTSPPKVG